MTAIIIISVFSVAACIFCMVYAEWRYKKDMKEFMDFVNEVYKEIDLVKEEENAKQGENGGDTSSQEEKTER